MEELLVGLCEAMRYAYIRGLISTLTGNASVRLGLFGSATASVDQELFG